MASLVLASLLFSAALSGCIAACEDDKQVLAGFPDSFVGVGVELKIQADWPVIVRVIPGGPAALAGFRAKDQIVAIGNVPTHRMTLGEVVSRLRGPAKSMVAVTVRRPGDDDHLRTAVVLRSRMVKRGERSGGASGAAAARRGARDDGAAAYDVSANGGNGQEGAGDAK